MPRPKRMSLAACSARTVCFAQSKPRLSSSRTQVCPCDTTTLSIWSSVADSTKLNTSLSLTRSLFWLTTRSPKRAPGRSFGLPAVISASCKSKNQKADLLRLQQSRSPPLFPEPTALRKKILWTSHGELGTFPSIVSPLACFSATRADSVRSILLWERELSMAGRFLGFMRFPLYRLGSFAIHSPLLVRIRRQEPMALCLDVLPGFDFRAHCSYGCPWVGIQNTRVDG